MTLSPSPNGQAEKGSRILIIGATGFIGHFIAQASLASGKSTYILSRAAAPCPSKARAIKALEDQGAISIHWEEQEMLEKGEDSERMQKIKGSVNDQEFMEKTLKEHEIDIVISAVGGGNLLEQAMLIRAMKAVGTIKRFLPSEFGHDVDRAEPVEPGLTMYNEKRRVRRLIEESGIPYTYICCNSIASWPYYDNTHPSEVLPPLDQFQIYGDGSVKAYFVAGADIGKFTVKAAEDVRTLNKIVHFRPSCNFLNINELATLWEKKIGRTLPRVVVSEDDLLAAAEENIIPQSVVASFTHDIFIKGCQVNFPVDGPNEIEVSSLYPDEPFQTMDECFNEFAGKIEEDKKHVVGTKGENIAHRLVDVLTAPKLCA